MCMEILFDMILIMNVIIGDFCRDNRTLEHMHGDFWVPDEISDGSPRPPLPSYVRRWRIYGVTTTPSVRF